MSTIKDPGDQATYPVPRIELNTNRYRIQQGTLQPSYGSGTKDGDKLRKKLQNACKKNFSSETTSFTDGGQHFSPQIQKTPQDSSETSSEEEEEETCLLLKLQQQYQQQQQLRHRIKKTMKKLQSIE